MTLREELENRMDAASIASTYPGGHEAGEPGDWSPDEPVYKYRFPVASAEDRYNVEALAADIRAGMKPMLKRKRPKLTGAALTRHRDFTHAGLRRGLDQSRMRRLMEVGAYDSCGVVDWFGLAWKLGGLGYSREPAVWLELADQTIHSLIVTAGIATTEARTGATYQLRDDQRASAAEDPVWLAGEDITRDNHPDVDPETES